MATRQPLSRPFVAVSTDFEKGEQLLESVPLNEPDDDTDSRVLTALEQLDSAVRGAVADGRLSTEGGR